MSSQFCQACNRMGWLKTKRRGRQSCHYLRGPLCLGMQTSDQHLMYVETVICRCGNLEFHLQISPLVGGVMGTPRDGPSQPVIQEKLSESLPAGVCALIGEDTQNASLTWIPVTTGMELDDINPLPVIPFTKYPSKGCGQHCWFQREGARHLS